MCVLCINYFLAFVYKLLKTDDTVALTLVWHFHLSLPSPRDSPTFLYGQRWGQVVRTSYTEAKFAKQAFFLRIRELNPSSKLLPDLCSFFWGGEGVSLSPTFLPSPYPLTCP